MGVEEMTFPVSAAIAALQPMAIRVTESTGSRTFMILLLVA
jgi:hypothetical protein